MVMQMTAGTLRFDRILMIGVMVVLSLSSMLLREVVGIRFVIDREECLSHKVEYEGDTVHVSFVVIKADTVWHFTDDGVDLLIKGPGDEHIHELLDRTSEKYEFISQKKGIYRFCFTNKSPYHETIDFDVQVAHFAYHNQHAKDEHFNPLFEQISKLEEALYNIQFEQHWLEAETDRQAVGLMIHHDSEELKTGYHTPGILKWVEMEDEPDYHRLHHDPVMSLDLNIAPVFRDSHLLPVGSINGWICLWQYSSKFDNTYICNPITREYMILPRQQYYRQGYAIIAYGFGFGLRSKEYKVVRTFQGCIPPDQTSGSRPSLLKSEVYTLGTDQWRSLGECSYWRNGYGGPFLNGHAHWTVIDQDFPEKLCAFDFDNETFKLFPSPPIETIEGSEIRFRGLGVLKGCLCQSDTFDSQFTIWVMKEYGIKKSWHKEVVVKQSISPDLDWVMWEPMHLLEGLQDGTFLMVYWEDRLVVYCPETKTMEDTKIFDRYFSGMAYRPSFLRLMNFELERVHVF